MKVITNCVGTTECNREWKVGVYGIGIVCIALVCIITNNNRI